MDTYKNSSVSDSDTDEYEECHQVRSLNNIERQNLKQGENEKWLFETGANVHATSSSKLITNTKLKYKLVRDAKGKTEQTTMTSTITIMDNHQKYSILENVLVIPTFRKNIISGSKLVKNIT